MPFWNLPDVKADSGEPIGLPAHAYPSYTDPGTYHTVKPWYSIDNLGEVGSTAVYPPFKIMSTLYVRLLMQPYNLK